MSKFFSQNCNCVIHSKLFLNVLTISHVLSVSKPKCETTDLNVKTGWYHAREDTLPPFSSSFVLRRKWGRVSYLAWYQPVFTFRSLVSHFGSGTVEIPYEGWLYILCLLNCFLGIHYVPAERMNRRVVHFYFQGSFVLSDTLNPHSSFPLWLLKISIGQFR